MNYIKTMIDIRKENGETQKELADALGWSRPQIARYETEKSTPTIEYLIAFCTHYKISADFLLGIPQHYERTRKKRKEMKHGTNNKHS